MDSERALRMHAERTPNPNSIKWVLGAPLLEGDAIAHFESGPGPEVSPLAARLFAVDGVVRVMLASNFATVSKREEVVWTDIAQPIVDALREHLASGEPALGPAFTPARVEPSGELVARIRQLLEDEIRPAVARDGGHVSFAGLRGGVVELRMGGACSGCPSAAATLERAIEARLREAIPEVTEVVAV